MTTKQVCFRAEGETEFFGGILVNDEYVICGCCGGVVPIDEVAEMELYKNWVNISDEFMGR